MSLPGWMGWLARDGERRPVRPCLEALEDRLTPSGNVLTLPTSPQGLSLGQSSQAITVQLQDDSGKLLDSLKDLVSSFSSNPAGASSASVGGKPTLTANGSSLNGAGNSAMQQEITVQLVDGLGNLVTALQSVLVQATGSSGTGAAGSSSARFAISSSGGGTLTLTATQQETIQGLSSLVFTTSPLTAGQISQPLTLQLDANNGKTATTPSDGLILYLASNSSHQGSSTMEFVDANSGSYPTA
jgi:hypothetical protein